ncbi:MAG TPA: TolC family protein [Terriglobales bacterium]|nr:TolC family protein [Terriglobales bacterium]
MSAVRTAGLTLVAVFMALTATAWGQPAPSSMTVEDLLRQVTEHPDLRAARLEVEAAEGRLLQAGLRPNPMLELGGQKALGPDNNLMVGVIVPLDLNGRKEGRVGVADAEAAMRRAQLAERERRLRADVRTKAGEVLAAQRTLATTTALLETNRRALSVVRDRVREGGAPAIDENLQLVEVNRLESMQRRQQARVELLTLQLMTIAGVAVVPAPALTGELGAPALDLAIEDAVRRALTVRPDVQAARADVAVAAARVRKEEAEGRWDASVNVGYQRQDFGYDLRGLTPSGATRPIQDVFHYVGAGVTITLPVRNANQGNIAAARAEQQASERRRALAELTVRHEVAAAWAQAEGARQSLALYERGVRDVAGRNVDIVRQAYQLGRGSLLDVIAEQRRFIEVETGYTEALRQVWDAATDAERAVGAPLR